MSNQKNIPVVVKCNVYGKAENITVGELIEPNATECKKLRIVGGNALPKAMREASNVKGKLTAAQVALIVKRQEKRRAQMAESAQG